MPPLRKSDPPQTAASALLQRAQVIARKEAAAAPIGDACDLSPHALRELLHNLRLHQIELEVQNEELRHTQVALETAQVRYFDFYDLAPVGYVTVNDKALILQANLTTAAMLGVKRSDLLGKALPGFMSALDADQYCLLSRRALASGTVQTLELQMEKRDSQLFWAKLQAIAATGDDGDVVIRLVLSDITERRQAQAQLLASHQLRDAILDSVPAQIAVLDQNGTILAVNQRWHQFALDNSTTPGEPARNTQVGVNYLDICQGASTADADQGAASAWQGIVSVIRGSAASFQFEYPCHSPTQQRWFALAVTPLGSGDHAVVLTHTDITHRRQLEQTVKDASEHKFRLVADSTSDGIVMVGANRHIEYVSAAYVKLLGYSDVDDGQRSAEMAYAMMHQQDPNAMSERLERAIQGKECDFLVSYCNQHRLGHELWLESSAKLQFDDTGRFLGACFATRDITQRKMAQEALTASELRYRKLMADLPVGVLVQGPNAEILLGNDKALDLLGLTQNQLLGKTSFDSDWNTIYEDGTPFAGTDRPTPRALATGQPVHDVVMGVFRPATQDRAWLLVSALPELNPDASVKQVVVTLSDITDSKRAKLALTEVNLHLRQARQELRQLLAQNESALENEKRHIAREVHDELGQVLTALRMNLSLAIIRNGSHVPDLLEELKDMKVQVDRAILGVRNVASRLRPASLDMGLVPAIEWLCMEISKHGQVECSLYGTDQPFALDESRAIVIFRIVQESLTNISKYAQACQVEITLEQRERELSVEICDNGLGFDMDAVARRASLGLLGMRERAITLGGQLVVSSTPGQGTRVSVVIPMEPPLPDEPKDAS